MDDKKKSFFGKLWRSVVKNNIPLGNTIVQAIDGGDVDEIFETISRDKDLSESEKEIMLSELEQDIIEQQEVTKRWELDMKSDNKLSKNIRPLSLAFLTTSMFIYIILDSSLEGFKMAPEWVSLLGNLLMLVYGAYFSARTLEKIRKK